MSYPYEASYGGRFRLPKPDYGDGGPIQTVEKLREHLQAAMAVELSTIPLYLYGMYSVKDAPAVVKAVHGVVLEEMLHLSLAGNTLLAVGGTPKLYDPEIISAYPTPMLGRTPELILSLRKMTKENLQTYIDLELPEASDAPAQPDEYQTLGQFYKAIEQGLTFLSKYPGLFNPATTSSQFGPGSVFTPHPADAGGLVFVTDLPSALTALTTIVDQGEGNPRPFDDPSRAENDHYDIFLNLQKDAQWEVFPVVTDPTTAAYFHLDKKIYAVSRTVDASFCYLLLTLEKLWTVSSVDGRQKLIDAMFPLMSGILAPLARFLVQQPIGSAGEVAAPCFGYYPFGSPDRALTDLMQEIQAAIEAYVGNVNAQAQLTSVQTTIGELVDIATFN
jgi:hypothetical protein